jgi:hypothetical protein
VSSDAPEEEAPRPAESDDDAEPGAGREAAASSDEAASDERPARRKRKKKRPEPAGDDDAATDEAPPRREGIPAFALGFPSDPTLDALVASFEDGDYARVRREAPALVKATDSAEVRKAARELLKRLDPDPVAVYLLAGAALLLTFLAFWYWTHPHAAP